MNVGVGGWVGGLGVSRLRSRCSGVCAQLLSYFGSVTFGGTTKSGAGGQAGGWSCKPARESLRLLRPHPPP